MTGSDAGALSLAGGAAVVGVLCLVTARAAALDALPRNGVLGIRTRRTRRSDAAWSAGHRAGARWLRLAGVVGLAVGVLTPVVFVLMSAAAWWFVAVGLVAVVGLLVAAARVADLAAERA